MLTPMTRIAGIAVEKISQPGVVADGYAVGFVSGAVAKFERKINIAPSTRINRVVAIVIVTLKNRLPPMLVVRRALASGGCFDRTTS